MHDAALEAAPTDQLRAGIRVSGVSIVWTVAASTVAVVLGLDTGSVVLVAFGLTGLLDAAGSVSLVVHFRHALHHEAFSEGHERWALRIITLGLVIVGAVTITQSLSQLATGADPAESPMGMAVAALSIVVLAALSVRKHQVARRLRSHALHADGWLTATGCVLAIVTVSGAGLTSALGWWWADPSAAIVVAGAAIVLAALMWRNGHHADQHAEPHSHQL